MENIEITRIIDNSQEIVSDDVAEEIPLTIYYNDEELVTLLCSPFDLKELAIGFLYSSGLIKSMEDISAISEDNQKWVIFVQTKNKIDIKDFISKRIFTSGCGKGTLFYNAMDLIKRKKIKNNIRISTENIFKLMSEFNKNGEIFKKTGCTHSSALSNLDNLITFKEDIGRHNSVDKVIGDCMIKNIDIKNLMLFTSGRISSDIVFKAQKAEIPIIISRSAPTNQAVKLCKEFNITLICFMRGKRMNIYCNKEIIADSPGEIS